MVPPRALLVPPSLCPSLQSSLVVHHLGIALARLERRHTKCTTTDLDCSGDEKERGLAALQVTLHVPRAVAPLTRLATSASTRQRRQPTLERRVERLVDGADVDELDLGAHLRGEVRLDVALVGEGEDGARDACAVGGEDLQSGAPGEGCGRRAREKARGRGGRTFSLIPPTGVTRPRRVTSPVMAVCARGGMPRTG